MGKFLNTTVARKFAMGLSGLFLVSFLILHVTVNFISTISPDIYNTLSEFMGYNFVVQAVLQPVLVVGVLFHFLMAFRLESDNKKARPVKYVKYNQNSNTTWMSRNMIYTGLVIFLFLGLHMYDFFFPELALKFDQGYQLSSGPDGIERFYDGLVSKFQNPVRVGIYVLAFVALMLHLLHGFYGSFQSVGWGDKNSMAMKGFAKWFSIIVPLLFIYIALFHFINNLGS